VQDTAKRIQGLITKIEGTLNSAQPIIGLGKKLGERLGLLEPETKPSAPLIPDGVKKLIAAFAAGSHFAVRVTDVTSIALDEKSLKPVRSISLTNDFSKYPARFVTVMMPSGEVLQGMPVVYTANLISPTEHGYGLPLYPDADATVSSGVVTISETEANGHRLAIVDNFPDTQAVVSVNATKLENKEDRVATLHVSGEILTPNLGEFFKKYIQPYAGMVDSYGVSPEELRSMFEDMKMALNVSPWVTQVILTNNEIAIEPGQLAGRVGLGYDFGVSCDLAIRSQKNSSTRWKFEREGSPATKKPEWRAVMGVECGTGAAVVFSEPGTYKVTATLILNPDTADERVYATATAKATITKETPNLEISIDPSQVTGESQCQLRFEAIPNLENHYLPDEILWVWDYGDKSEVFERSGYPSRNALFNDVAHAYANPGQYEIKLRMLEKASRTLVASASATVNIDNAAAISKTTSARASLYASKQIRTYSDLDGVLTTKSDWNPFGHVALGAVGTGDQRLKWEADQTFKVSWTKEYETQKTVYTIEGRVSKDAGTLESITITTVFEDPDYGGPGIAWNQTESLTLKDIPLKKYSCGDNVAFNAHISGDDVRQHVDNYEFSSRLVGAFHADGDRVERFMGFNWDDTSQIPILEVEFEIVD
jgi:hypothetical protein